MKMKFRKHMDKICDRKTDEEIEKKRGGFYIRCERKRGMLTETIAKNPLFPGIHMALSTYVLLSLLFYYCFTF